jgi:hypothetical protein
LKRNIVHIVEGLQGGWCTFVVVELFKKTKLVDLRRRRFKVGCHFFSLVKTQLFILLFASCIETGKKRPPEQKGVGSESRFWRENISASIATWPETETIVLLFDSSACSAKREKKFHFYLSFIFYHFFQDGGSPASGCAATGFVISVSARAKSKEEPVPCSHGKLNARAHPSSKSCLKKNVWGGGGCRKRVTGGTGGFPSHLGHPKKRLFY